MDSVVDYLLRFPMVVSLRKENVGNYEWSSIMVKILGKAELYLLLASELYPW